MTNIGIIISVMRDIFAVCNSESNLFIVTTSEFSVYWAQNRELSTNPCSRFLYSLGPRFLHQMEPSGACIQFRTVAFNWVHYQARLSNMVVVIVEINLRWINICKTSATLRSTSVGFDRSFRKFSAKVSLILSIILILYVDGSCL